MDGISRPTLFQTSVSISSDGDGGVPGVVVENLEVVAAVDEDHEEFGGGEGQQGAPLSSGVHLDHHLDGQVAAHQGR